MRVSRLWYRLICFALATVALGLAGSAAVNDSISRYYFQTRHLSNILAMWLGPVAALAFVIEGTFLVGRRWLTRKALTSRSS